MSNLSDKITRAVVPLSNLPEKTVEVDNSVLALSFTGVTGGAVSYAKGQAFKDSNGVYSYRFTYFVTHDADLDFQVITTGVISAAAQNCGASASSTGDVVGRAVFNNGTGVLQITYIDGTQTGSFLSGYISLGANKPSWFDANREAGFSIVGQVEAGTSTTAGLTTSYVPYVQSRTKVVSSANYTILANDGFDVVLVATGSSDRTISLPPAADSTGRIIEIFKTDGGGTSDRILVDPNGAEEIGGSSNSYEVWGLIGRVKIVSDGLEWFILSDYSSYTINLDGHVDKGDWLNGVFDVVRVGSVVNIMSGSTLNATATASTYISANGLIATKFRPVGQDAFVTVRFFSATSFREARITTSGAMQFIVGTGGSTNTSGPLQMTYHVT